MKTRPYFTIILLSLLFSVHVRTNAQTPGWLWANAIGGAGTDGGFSIAVDPTGSGDVYTTGWFQGTVDFDPGAGTFNLTSAGDYDIFISKSDGSGNFEWAKAMGGTGYDRGASIAVDPTGSGDVYTTGQFEGTVDFDPGAGIFDLTAVGSGSAVFVLKLDASGNFVWAKNMGGGSSFGGVGQSIAVNPSGNIFITGEFYGTIDFDPGAGTANLTAASANFADIFISKLDASGNFAWAKAMGGIRQDQATAIAADASGNVYTTGFFQGTADFDPGAGTFNLTVPIGVFADVFISKLDAAGNLAWAKMFGGASYDDGASILLDAMGNVYTTGSFSGTVDFDPGAGAFDLIAAGGSDIFISKSDTSGNFIWAQTIGGPDDDYGTSIAVDPTGSGDVYATGYFKGTVDFDPDLTENFNLTSAGGYDICVSKFDGTGNFVWAKAMGGTTDDVGSSIALDALGHVHVAGQFNSPSISLDSTTLSNAAPTGLTGDIFIAKLDIIVSGTESREDNMGIALFPNPATGTVQFDFGNNPAEPFHLTLTDAAGRVVISKKAVDKELNVSHLLPGLYFMKIQNGERTGTVKLLKQ